METVNELKENILNITFFPFYLDDQNLAELP